MQSGCAFNVSQVLSPITTGASERMLEETMVAFCLERLLKEIFRAGGVDSAIIERLFPITRSPGLRNE